jgi:lambda repressor-like predicted transcriptional regulator
MDLATYLLDKGISMYAFSRDTGISYSTIYNIVRKGLRPYKITAQLIESHTNGIVSKKDLLKLTPHQKYKI